VAHPRGDSSSTVSRLNWNLEISVCEGRGKMEYPEKNISDQGKEPRTDTNHI